MKFKMPYMEAQLQDCPDKLQELAAWADSYCIKMFGKELFITRVSDTYPGESGVHPEKRAFDVRDEWFNGKDNKFYFTEEEIKEIVDETNREYPRDDGHETAIYHSFNGAPFHIHFQIPASWV